MDVDGAWRAPSRCCAASRVHGRKFGDPPRSVLGAKLRFRELRPISDDLLEADRDTGAARFEIPRGVERALCAFERAIGTLEPCAHSGPFTLAIFPHPSVEDREGLATVG
jgi:hypothetical protein